jgi:hypothetical protein
MKAVAAGAVITFADKSVDPAADHPWVRQRQRRLELRSRRAGPVSPAALQRMAALTPPPPTAAELEVLVARLMSVDAPPLALSPNTATLTRESGLGRAHDLRRC